MDLAARVLGERRASLAREAFRCDQELNLTHLALTVSHYVNGVAKKHGEISRNMFPEQRIDAITNGVHAATWMSPPFQRLFDRHVPDWREDNFGLRAALEIPRDQIWEAHLESKRELIRLREPQRQRRDGSRPPDHRVRPARDRLQAARPSLLGPGSAQRRSPLEGVRCRSCTAARPTPTTRTARRSSSASSPREMPCAVKSTWSTCRTTTWSWASC